MWVKICGLTNPDDAHVAIQAGADALGFVFARRSPRCLPVHSPGWHEWVAGLPSFCDTLARSAGERKRQIPLVIVLTAPDELPVDWRLFDAVQWVVPDGILPDGDTLRWLPDLPLWAAFRFPPERSVDDALQILESWSPYAERFVLDTYHPHQLGGTGATHDWQRAAALCVHASKPVILAGGLNPDNVAQAVRLVRPAGVDVSSGVEASPGRKDAAKVRAFIRHAKRVQEVGVE